MGVRIGSAPAATARSSEPRDRASRLPPPGAASTSLEGTYGRELVHRIVAHLLHLLGSFGFIGLANFIVATVDEVDVFVRHSGLKIKAVVKNFVEVTHVVCLKVQV